jgi:hypothetical protein
VTATGRAAPHPSAPRRATPHLTAPRLTRPRRFARLLILVTALALAATLGGPGHGARAGGGALAAVRASALLGPASAAAAPGESRTVYFTQRLRRDLVYVSPALSRVVSPSDEAALRRAVAAMPYPTFVVVAPRFTDETDPETFSDLPTLLHDRLDRDGLYLVANEGGSELGAAAFGVRPRGDASRLSSTVLDAVPRRDGPVARVLVALDVLRSGTVPDRSVEAEEAAEDNRFWWILGFVTLATAAVVVGAASATPGARRRRAERRRRSGDAGAAREAAPPAVAPEIDRGEARREAQDAVAGLARAIAEAPAPPDRALCSYDAASHVLGRKRARAIDYVGARTLAAAGRAQLGGRDTWRPCLFDPRHGEGVRPTRWRRGGQDVSIPACADCAAAIGRGASPPVLQDRGRPYWDRDTVWARTGFGAVDDAVADVVLAGEERP